MSLYVRRSLAHAWCASTRSTSRSRCSSASGGLAVLRRRADRRCASSSTTSSDGGAGHVQSLILAVGAGHRRLPDHADRAGRRSDRRAAARCSRTRCFRVRELELRLGRRGRTSSGSRRRAGAAGARRERPPGRDDRVPLRHVRPRPQREPPARAGRSPAPASTVEELHEPLWEETRAQGRRLLRPPPRWPASRGRWAARRRAGSPRRWRRRRARRRWWWSGSAASSTCCSRARVCRPRAGLVFAPLVSLSETLVEDRGVFPAGRRRARAASAALDRADASGAADLVLADTAAHADYLRELGAPPRTGGRLAPRRRAGVPSPPRRRGRPCRAACSSTAATCRCTASTRSSRAAARLGDARRGRPHRQRPGARRAWRRWRARSGARVTWRDDVPLAALPGELAAAAVVLGVFGAGRKAAMVVPNKVYQAAAAGRPARHARRPGAARGARARATTVSPARRAIRTRWPAAIARLLDDPALAARLGRCGARARAGAVRPERAGRPAAVLRRARSASRPASARGAGAAA